MAASEGMVSDVKFEENNVSPKCYLDEKIKFKDPLLTGLDKDSDDDGMESLDLEASARSEEGSVSCSSSLIANFRLDDDYEGDTRDLFIIVDDPEKHTSTLEAYVTFRITTKTSRTEFEGTEFSVRRRYNDFLWIRQRLEEKHPTHLVPPLPEKHSLKRLDRFSTEFLKVRQAALQKFLTRVADHPVLSFDSCFQIFLTAKAWEFQAHKKQGSGFLSRVSDSLHNMSASYMMKNRPPEFAVMHDYIIMLSDKLGVMDRIAQRVAKEQIDYMTELMEWGPCYTLWANSEDQLTGALLTMSKAVDECVKAVKDLIDDTDTRFAQPLKEYLLYAECIKQLPDIRGPERADVATLDNLYGSVDSLRMPAAFFEKIKTVLRRRDAIQNEYDMVVEELNKRKDEKENIKASDQTYSIGAFLGKDPEDVKQQKHEKLEQQISDLIHQMETLNDKTVVANADLKADMERWHKHKQRDLRETFMCLADLQITYYEKCLSIWENTIRTIQNKEHIQLPSTAALNEQHSSALV